VSSVESMIALGGQRFGQLAQCLVSLADANQTLSG
jgi:hypothetical protein